MAKKNIVVVSLDEVRPDHLSCNGYNKINTNHIDLVAKQGVRFETCISTADFTPIAMGTVITGKYPHKHGVRDAYCHHRWLCGKWTIGKATWLCRRF